MKTWFWAEVPAMGLIPHKWLGLAWRRYDRDTGIYVVMPLNRLLRLAVNWWYWLRFPAPSEWDKRALALAARHYDDGFRSGADLGQMRATDEYMGKMADEYQRGYGDALACIRKMAGLEGEG